MQCSRLLPIPSLALLVAMARPADHARIRRPAVAVAVPLQHHPRLLQYKLPLLVLLTLLKRTLVLPPQHAPAHTTLYIAHGMHPGYQQPLLNRTLRHVHHVREQVRTAVPTLERL